jgi:MFS family permease
MSDFEENNNNNALLQRNDAIVNRSKSLPKANISQFAWLAAGVSVFALLLMFRPSEAVLIDYIVSQRWSSNDALANDVLPWFSYAFAAFSLLFALVASISGVKVLVIVGCFCNLCSTIIWFALGYNHSLLVFTQFLVGLFFAALAVFQALLLAVTPRDRHAAITAFLRCAYLIGTVGGALCGQLLSAQLPPADAEAAMFYVSIALSAASFIGSFFLPNDPLLPLLPPSSSNNDAVSPTANGARWLWLVELRASCVNLWLAMRDTRLVRLALWSALWLAVHMLVLVHYQALFEQFTGAPNNNLVLGVAYGAAALFALIQSFAPVQRILMYSVDFWLALAGLFATLCLYGLHNAPREHAIVIYTCFVIYHVCFEFVQPFLIVQMARRLKRAQFAVVFGATSSLALLVQVLLQIIIQVTPWFRAAVENKFSLFMGVSAALAILPLLLTVLGKCFCSSSGPR